MGHRNISEVWRLAPLYLMWCIWRDCGLSNSLYTWIATHNNLFLFVLFFNLLDLCSCFSP